MQQECWILCSVLKIRKSLGSHRLHVPRKQQVPMLEKTSVGKWSRPRAAEVLFLTSSPGYLSCVKVNGAWTRKHTTNVCVLVFFSCLIYHQKCHFLPSLSNTVQLLKLNCVIRLVYIEFPSIAAFLKSCLPLTPQSSGTKTRKRPVQGSLSHIIHTVCMRKVYP